MPVIYQVRKIIIKMEEKNAIIYGVKTKDTIHYIGKTNKRRIGFNTNKPISNSKVQVQYVNPVLRDIFHNYENVTIEPIIFVPESEWYPEKLREVVEHANKKHPLINAQWMIDGKNGYWEGKKRDAHTLLMLSQSKFRQFVEYDKNGNLKKIWNSGKEAAIKIFGDYKVINGAGSSKLYRIVKSVSIKKRFAHDSYWFKLEELIKYFNGIPEKLHLRSMVKREAENRRLKRIINNKKRTKTTRCCVELYERTTNELITIYLNTKEAAYKLKISVDTIRRLCSGETRPAADFILRYGEKIVQSKNIKHPEYQILPLKRISGKWESKKSIENKKRKEEKRRLIELQKIEEENKRIEEENKRIELRKEMLSTNKAMNISIADMDNELSVRALNGLRCAKIETLGELVQYDRKHLMYFRNIGIKTVCEIEELLSKYNLSLS
jgi:hypothetical protein